MYFTSTLFENNSLLPCGIANLQDFCGDQFGPASAFAAKSGWSFRLHPPSFQMFIYLMLTIKRAPKMNFALCLLSLFSIIAHHTARVKMAALAAAFPNSFSAVQSQQEVEPDWMRQEVVTGVRKRSSCSL